MAGIQDITQGAFYRGDANLGGGGTEALLIDLSPWQKLADYSFIKGKMLYEDKLARYKEATAEAAKSMKIDWSKIPNDFRSEIMGDVEDMKDFLLKNPNAADRMEAGDKVFFEFQEKYNNLTNKAAAGTQRGIEIATGEKSIRDKAVNKTQFEALMTDFRGKVGKDIYETINPFEEYVYTPIDITGKTTTFTKVENLPNVLKTTEIQGYNFNPGDIPGMELDGKYAPNQNLIDGQKKAAEAFNEIFLGTADKPGALLLKGTDGKYKNIQTSKENSFLGFTQEALNDPQLGGFLQQIEGFNQGLNKFKALGGQSTMNAINPLDGISETEIKQIIRWGNSTNSITEKAIYTGAANQLKLERESNAAALKLARENNTARDTATVQGGNTIDFFTNMKEGPVNESGMNQVEYALLQSKMKMAEGEPEFPKTFTAGLFVKKEGNNLVYYRKENGRDVKKMETSGVGYNAEINTQLSKISQKGFNTAAGNSATLVVPTASEF